VRRHHVQVLKLGDIRPAPENDDIYGAVAVDDPQILDLARSIREHGLQEPIAVSEDFVIISGHRRHVACRIAKLELVRVLVKPVSYQYDRQEFIKLLVEANSQRIKSESVHLKEELIKIDPKEAHKIIVNERIQKDTGIGIDLAEIAPDSDGQRCHISRNKLPFLNKVIEVINENLDYWPLSVRQIHYRLLGPDAPLKHAKKPDSAYRNDRKSYAALCDLCSRARVEGRIPWTAIDDETRTTDKHTAFWNPAQFFRQELKSLLSGYWRNLQQSQPHHVEVVAEKLTVRTILKTVCQEFTLPLTVSRGMSSLPPKKAIYDRYKRSGKDRLILLVVSDLDPAGDAIAEDLVKSFRRDFGIEDIVAYKVALTIDQVEDFDLEPSMDAKDSSPTYDVFVARYGITDAYELEALTPEQLSDLLRSSIESVLDIDLINQERVTEERDSHRIVAIRKQVEQFIKTLPIEEAA
jgi:ParB-like nuclease domain